MADMLVADLGLNLGPYNSALSTAASGARKLSGQVAAMGGKFASPFGVMQNSASSCFSRVVAFATKAAATVGAIWGEVKLLEAGAQSEYAKDVFSNLTGSSRKAGDAILKNLQKATDGTLTLGRTASVANRMLLQGWDPKQIEKVLYSVSKIAPTVGADVESAILATSSAMATGRTGILQKLGMIREGLKEVDEQYDAIHGKGAWDKLSQEARKAESATAILKEMDSTMKMLNVTGGETIFKFDALATPFKDMVVSFQGAIARSKVFNSFLDKTGSVLYGLRDILENFDFDSFVEGVMNVASAFGNLFVQISVIASDIRGIVYDLAKAVILNAASIIKAGARLVWAPLKFGLVTSGAAIIGTTRTIAEKMLSALLWIGTPIAKFFAKIAEYLRVPVMNALSKVGQAIDNFVEAHPDIAKDLGITGMGQAMISMASGMRAADPVKAVDEELKKMKLKMEDFKDSNDTFWSKAATTVGKEYEGMWTEFKTAGKDCWDEIDAVSQNSATSIKERLTDISSRWGMMKGSVTSMFTGFAGMALDFLVKKVAPDGGKKKPTIQAPPAPAKEYGWLKGGRAVPAATAAPVEKEAAGGRGSGGEGEEKLSPWEKRVEKEKRRMAKGLGPSMSVESQAARRYLYQQEAQERFQKAKESFAGQEEFLRGQVEEGNVTPEEADKMRQKLGQKTFGKATFKKMEKVAEFAPKKQLENLRRMAGLKKAKTTKGQTPGQLKKKGPVPKKGKKLGQMKGKVRGGEADATIQVDAETEGAKTALDEVKERVDQMPKTLDIQINVTATGEVELLGKSLPESKKSKKSNIPSSKKGTHATGKVVSKASGGFVGSPGASGSDSIPAMLSPGEFVVNSKSASRYQSFLGQINEGKTPKFQGGGWVLGAANYASVAQLFSGQEYRFQKNRQMEANSPWQKGVTVVTNTPINKGVVRNVIEPELRRAQERNQGASMRTGTTNMIKRFYSTAKTRGQFDAR